MIKMTLENNSLSPYILINAAGNEIIFWFAKTVTFFNSIMHTILDDFINTKEYESRLRKINLYECKQPSFPYIAKGLNYCHAKLFNGKWSDFKAKMLIEMISFVASCT